MKTKKQKVLVPKTYVEVIQLSQRNELNLPTMTEKWLLGCYRYYQSLLEINENKKVAEKWWIGIIKSYNEKVLR